MRYLSCIFFLALSVETWAQGSTPVIIGQNPLSTNEEQSLTIQLTDLRVRDRGNFFYPFGYTLTVYEGPNYTLSGQTITPSLDFNGVLTVPVSVNNGRRESEQYNLQVTVIPVNDPPVITSAVSHTIIENTSITLRLSDLTVTDPDNVYPDDFRLIINNGNNYTVSGTTVTPNNGYVGTLRVPVVVNDGQDNSAPYNMTIVVESANKRPVITGQKTISTAKNQPVTIALTHLTVTDPDNIYPDDFTLLIYPAGNYSVSGNTVTPLNNFTGNLVVKVAVNDGNSTSEPFNINITVNDVLHITGQESVTINEDESYTITLADLKVYDPKNEFPNNYRINIAPGEKYTSTGAQVQPLADYNGVLGVSITITNGTYTSPAYNFMINITPVNDPPEILDFPTDAVRFSFGNGPVNIIKEVNLVDVDDTDLAFGEVGIQADLYEPGYDELIVNSSPNINAVFDPISGILSLIGRAPIAEYASLLNSIQYNFIDKEGPDPENRIVYIKLSDGKDVSETYERVIVMIESIEVDIPNAFTPNGDQANDTWKVRLKRPSERYNNAVIRVFNKRGALVFETKGFERDWDGRYQGEVLQPDTYFYTIDFNLNSSSKNVKGAVIILR